MVQLYVQPGRVLGVVPPTLRQLPVVAYFHENQLAYPSQTTDPRDVHFAFTNWTTALAATEVWFNSSYNRDSLLSGLSGVFRQLPDHKDAFDAEPIRRKSKILAPGIDAFELAPRSNEVTNAPLHIAWAARFEHDKGPDILLAALERLSADDVPFSLTLMGQQFTACPEPLLRIQREFAPQLRHFGFEPDRSQYLRGLASADVFISTAHHEFFGLSVLEAARAGCSLLLPERLSYPELFTRSDSNGKPLFYDGSPEDLVRGLKELAKMPAQARPEYRSVAAKHAWPLAARSLIRGSTR